DMAVMNPGSLTYPRQEGRLPSYIILEIDENGKISGEIKYIKKK
ncbi:YfcE family phosphodiesterase, partial [Drancourtella sp. An210]